MLPAGAGEIAKLAAAIGKKAVANMEDLKFGVEILDVRKVWSRVDYLVKPIAGKGEQWISGSRISDIVDDVMDVLS